MAEPAETRGQQKGSQPVLNMSYFKRKSNYKPKKAFYNTTDYFYPFEQSIEAEPGFVEEQKLFSNDHFGDNILE